MLSPRVLAGFVTFEGIDGAGKTTVSRLVAEFLRAKGHAVFLTSEPTKTWLGDAVRHAYDDDVGAVAESFLFLADRAAHVEEIRSHLEDGELVLCDRYADSTYAYQGARLKGIVPDPIPWLRALSRPVVLEPDLTILLEISVRLGLRRIAGRKRKIRFEKERFLTEVAANYRRIARGRRHATIDGSGPAATVARDALAVIERRLGLRRR